MIAGPLPVPADLAARVEATELARLLGYPDRRVPDGRALRRAEQSRGWYARNGRPWAFARDLTVERATAAGLQLDDGNALARRLAEAEATALLVAVVSAGGTADERADELWRDRRPDEAYFLDRFAAAVVEHLAAWAGRHLRELARRHGLGLLPGLSPGNEGWDLRQQTVAARCLTGGEPTPPPGAFEVLSSGMIRPRSSLLTVFGLSPRLEAAEAVWHHQPCGWCSLTACGFRRVRVAGHSAPPPAPAVMAYDPAAEEAR